MAVNNSNLYDVVHDDHEGYLNVASKLGGFLACDESRSYYVSPDQDKAMHFSSLGDARAIADNHIHLFMPKTDANGNASLFRESRGSAKIETIKYIRQTMACSLALAKKLHDTWFEACLISSDGSTSDRDRIARYCYLTASKTDELESKYCTHEYIWSCEVFHAEYNNIIYSITYILTPRNTPIRL